MSAISGASSSSALQQLLSLIRLTSVSGDDSSGQNQPSQATDASRKAPLGPPPGPPPSGRPAGSKFSDVTMAQLLSSQDSANGSTSSAASDPLSFDTKAFADQLISQLGGTDGQVSLSQIESKLGLSSDASSSLSQTFGELDANGDGELSSSELATALQTAAPPQGPPPFMSEASSNDGSSIADALSNDLINSLGGRDGAISLSQWTDALSSDTQASTSSATDGTTSSDQASSAATQLFKGLDTNGDGVLTAVEIASALQSFMATQLAGQGVSRSEAQTGSSLVV